jgi:transposase InsO family protein
MEEDDQDEDPQPEARSMVDEDPHHTRGDQQHYLQMRRRSEDLPHFEMDTTRESQVCLPESLQRMCLKFLHEGNGHPGSRRTRASVAAKYYWLGMNEDIEHHVQACVHCARRKSDNSTKATLPLGRSPVPTRPMQHVHTDLITNLPRSRRGNIHISVTVDSLTGYLHATALPDRTATTVAEAWINDIMLHFGCPEVVTTDNGVEYTNNLMRAVNALLQIRHHYTVPYNPQANGKVEKRNGTLMATLTQFASANQDDWDVYLPIAVWSYNTTINHATGYTPFRAVFGREAR